MLTDMNSSIIYISQKDGNDSYNGFSPVAKDNNEGPIKSLTRLNALIKECRVEGRDDPITVRFMGDHELNESIHIEDNNDITFESFGENKARIIGGKILKGFKKDVFNGAECLSLYIPEVENGQWHFTDLFVNGKPAKLARYPKTGTLKAVTTEHPDNWAIFNNSKWFIAFKEDLQNISSVEDAIVSFNHFWVDEHSPVESYDHDTGKLVLKYPSRFMITVDYEENKCSDLHYYLENVAEAFGAEGEWFLSVKKGILYYVPKEGETVETIEVIAPTVKHFAKICGTKENKVNGIRFKNLEFIATKGDYKSCAKYSLNNDCEDTYYASDIQSCFAAHGAIRFENTEDSSIESCNILCSGVHAVEINKGCQHVRVENCNIENSGAGGVKIFGAAAEGDDNDLRPTSNCVIRGNTIKNCGLRYAAGCGVLACHTAHNEISENEISYLEYTGISVGWVWGYAPSSTYGNIIKNNHIHHIGQGRLSDMGGIYLLGIQHGTVVSGNVIHDVISSNYGGMGIYTDEGSSYITIENNLVFRCKDSCYQHHYGKNNTVRGNVFAFAGQGLMFLCREENHTPLVVQENTFITDGSPVYITGSGEVNPKLVTSCNRFWSTTEASPAIFNKKEGSVSIGLQEWKEMGYDDGSVIEKPCDSILKKVNE